MQNKALKFLFLLFLLSLLISNSFAVKYISQKSFIKKHVSKDHKLSKNKLSLTSEQKAEIKTKWGIEPDITDFTFYIGRKDGIIDVVVYLVTFTATEHKCIHNMGFAFNGDGSIKEVAMTECFCEYVMLLSNQSFLGQFKNKPARTLKINEDISAVTTATLSTIETIKAVNSAMAAYVEFIKK